MKKKEERNELLPKIPKNYLDKYVHIASARNGLAVVPVKRESVRDVSSVSGLN